MYIHMKIWLSTLIYMFNVSGSGIGEGGVSYRFKHDVKAGLSLRCAHMGFFVLLMHSCSILMKTAQLVS